MIKFKQSHPYVAIPSKAPPKKHSGPFSFHCITINDKQASKKLVNSNSHYLHSNTALRLQQNTGQRIKGHSQQRVQVKTIRQAKQYVPLSKISPSPLKQTMEQWQQRKQLQYLQSQAYERYLQQICRNGSSSRQKLKSIKSIRSNNIYLPITKTQNPPTNNKNVTYYHHSDANSLSNLSKITHKNNILIQDPFDAEISCQPYLQTSSTHHENLPQDCLSNIKVIAYKEQNKFGKQNKDEKQTVRSSLELASKLAKRCKKQKKQSMGQTLRLGQADSIYNVDFKLERPQHMAGWDERCLSRSKSQGKKYIIVTSNQSHTRC